MQNIAVEVSTTQKKSFISGAAVLAAAVAVTKVLGALYKIPLGNMLDSTGMAHFYAAYNVYTLLLTLSTAGLPVVTSRLVAEATALGRHRQARRVFTTALWRLGLVGLVCTALMFSLPRACAHLLQDGDAWMAIRALSPAVVCVCLTSAVRGYTQGMNEMTPTAVSQIIESAGKLGVGLGLCAYLLRRGTSSAEGAAAAIFGVTVGAALALAFLLLVLVLRDRRVMVARPDTPAPRREILHQLVSGGVPITIAAVGMSLITLVDQALVLYTLQHSLHYTSAQAVELYGQYTFGMTLFVLPSSFIIPLSVSLMPTLSAERAKGNLTAQQHHIRMALRLTALFAFPMGAGLSVMAGPILSLLYPAVPDTAAAATPHLQVLGIASCCVCLMTITNGILQACGRERWPVWTLLSGGVVKVMATVLLVSNPHISIAGAAWGTLLGYAVIALLNLLCVRRAAGRGVGIVSALWRSAAATLVMAMFARGSYAFLAAKMEPTLATLLAIALAVVVYGILALAVGAVRKEDVKNLPFGRKLTKFVPFS